MVVVVLADAVARVDVADCYDVQHVHDAYNDARYDKHAHDEAPADEVHQAATVDAVVRADVVVAVRMQIPLISGIYMRICTFSYPTGAKVIPSIVND